MAGRYLLSAMMAFIAAYAGCSEIDSSRSDTKGTNLSSITDEAVVTSEDGQSDIDHDEGKEESLEIAWDECSIGTTVAAMSFTVANNTSEDLTFDLEVLADGALGSSMKSLGEHTLSGNQTVTLDIDAETLPVRSSVAVNVARARITRHIETWKGPRDVHSHSSPLYYRHAPEFGTVTTYSREGLEAELSGEVYSGAASIGETDMAETLGEKSNGEGEFSAVSLADSRMVIRDGSNEIVGVVSRVEIGVTDTETIAAAAIHASEAAAEETEASDE